MSPVEWEALAALVSEQVCRALGRVEPVGGAQPERPRTLIFGPWTDLPAAVKACRPLAGEEAYCDPDSLRGVERIYVTWLSRSQLADLAQGRDGSQLCCAVTSALLRGVPVFLLESALEHRQWSGTGAPALIQLLEGYVSTLQSFGVRLVGPDQTRAASVGQTKALPRLITEALARQLIPACGGALTVEAGAILTPSALDVLRQANIAVRRQ